MQKLPTMKVGLNYRLTYRQATGVHVVVVGTYRGVQIACEPSVRFDTASGSITVAIDSITRCHRTPAAISVATVETKVRAAKRAELEAAGR